jgi:hypothetical protein
MLDQDLAYVIERLTALQRRRRAALKNQQRIDRACESYLATLAGYRPKVDENGEKIRDAEGRPVKDVAGKKLWNEIGRVRRSVESHYSSEAKASDRPGHPPVAEKAIVGPPGRNLSRKGNKEGHSDSAEKAIEKSPSLPHWADVGFILASAQSRTIWDALRVEIETEMEALAKQLHVWPWWQAEVKGGGAKWLAVIVGEAGDVGSYKSKSHLWKRCGLAVIDGERQRKKASAEGAAAHGYNPQRRSELWNVGVGVVRAQWRGDRDEDGKKPAETGKPVAVPGHAVGRYGEMYARRKAFLAAREQRRNDEPWTPKHIDNDARRWMTKAILRDLRACWRAGGAFD